jgi:FkbM family methyltransferase
MTTRVQADGRIGLYLIGARDGFPNITLPVPVFANDQFFVFFEADETAIAQIEARNHPAWSRVFPVCLSDTNGPATFYHNYDPFTSSLLKPDPEFDLSQWSEGRHYPFSEVFRAVREEAVQTRTLDSLNLLDDPDVAPPTIIALDTQGSELAILLGGRDLVSAHTMAIVTEAEFVPFYEGQPVFGDVCAGLDKLGFLFVGFAFGPYKIDAFSAQLGLRSKQMLGFSDALFLRKPSAAKSPLQLAQLAFVALLYSHAGYAFHCLDLALAQDPNLDTVPGDRGYRVFLLELEAARKRMPHVDMPTFHDMYSTYELSNERFDSNVTRDTLDDHYRAGAKIIKDRLMEQSEALVALLSLENSPVEQCMAEYGFIEQATEVKQRRIDDTGIMTRTHGIIVERETKILGANDSGT